MKMRSMLVHIDRQRDNSITKHSMKFAIRIRNTAVSYTYAHVNEPFNCVVASHSCGSRNVHVM